MTDHIKNSVPLKEIKKFGFILTVFLLLIAGLSYYKGHMHRSTIMFVLSMTMLMLNIVKVSWMRPFYVVAMKFAAILGYINTRILLGLVFYLVFTPIRIVLSLSGRDLLDRKLEPQKKSYWHHRPEKKFSPERCERLF